MTTAPYGIRGLLGVVSAGGLALLPIGAVAQEAAPRDPDDVMDEITVTGSRIAKPDFEFSNPVVSVDTEAIAYSGKTNLTGVLKEMPALTGTLDNHDTQVFVGGTGISLLNLRNLGFDRTLVLVGGRRHVAGFPGSAAVDVNTIPIALIERIEVQTGGASAIYGADGVSGVINFVTKRDFEGLEVDAQFGQSEHGDAESLLVSAAGGLNFADGRGNVSLVLEHAKSEALHSSQRDFASRDYAVFLANRDDSFDDDDPNVPDNLPYVGVAYANSAAGGAIFTLVDGEDDGIPDFVGDGTPWDFGELPPLPEGFPISPGYQIGGSGIPYAAYNGDLLPEDERTTANLFLTYEITPEARLFGDFKFSRGDGFQTYQPTFDFDFPLVFAPDHPYVPQSIVDASGGELVLMTRDNFDLGITQEDITRETIRTVIGFDDQVADHLRYEVSYVYGQTKTRFDSINNRLGDRYAAAMDVVVDPSSGELVCRSILDPDTVPMNLDPDFNEGFLTYEPLPGTWAGSFQPGPDSGCVPINLFGDGSVSREAAAWINATTRATSKIKQQVAQAYLTGNTTDWFMLPAGPIGFAGGLEWRDESSESTPAIEDQLGLGWGNILQPSEGSYDVAEAFVELSVPLLADKPFFQTLVVDGAVRLSDYSTIGEATTWKAGLVWAPVSDISFRGTIAQATRAPNIGELFGPAGQTFEFIDDPCDINRLDEGTEFRAANCAALLQALGLDPVTFTDPNFAAVGGTSTGNPNLDEEVADTTTIGVVLRPRFIDGLVLAVDWYDIDLENAINAAPPQIASDLCVDLPTLDNQFCGLISRDEDDGRINDFTQQSVNVANFTTSGYDFQLAYTLDTARLSEGSGWGVFGVRVIGSKLEDLTYINLPNSDPDPARGEIDAPEWQGYFDLTWERGPLLVNYGLTYYGSTQRYTLLERSGDPDIVAPEYYDYDSTLTQDLQVRYQIREGLDTYLGVNNFTNEKPDVGEYYYPVSAVGRFLYAGVNVSAF